MSKPASPAAPSATLCPLRSPWGGYCKLSAGHSGPHEDGGEPDERELLRRVREVLGPKCEVDIGWLAGEGLSVDWCRKPGAECRTAQADTPTGALREILRRENGDGWA